VRPVLVVRDVDLKRPAADVPEASNEPLNFTVVPLLVVPSAENVPSAATGITPLYVSAALSRPGGWQPAS
jgi:hypothetical protein